jgi:prolipoprotein diacylglyceryltransferase
VKPIPVDFHIGPLQIHTYGIGLAVTFWFAYRYFARRLRDHGYPDEWLGRAFVWIIVSSVVGARAVHVISEWSIYSHHVSDMFAVWHGGLSSFGGLLGGVPVGLWCAHRWCRELQVVVATDLVSIVLVIAWSVGRLLGPQLMWQGGGPRTNAWYGMAYAGQVGERVPVPIFQAIECFVIWVVALQIEKFVRRRGRPLGLVATSVVTLYGLSRFFDEAVLLPHGTAGDQAVIGASLAFVAVGVAFSLWLLLRRPAVALPRSDSGGSVADPWANPHVADAPLEPPEPPSSSESLGSSPVAGHNGPGEDATVHHVPPTE